MVVVPARRCAWLAGAAGFALCWIVARAAIQSITIDEADAYLFYAWPASPSNWEAASGNHLLNSLLMRLFTGLFGLSALTVRMPSLVGAAIYIAAAYRLARLVSEEWILQLPLFVCLVYNPFVMDYLVVGRGYSLATACLLAAIALAAGATAPGAAGDTAAQPAPYRTCCGCSLLLALSFCASFSFAVVDAVTLVFIFVWFARRGGTRYPALLAACILPGLLLAALLAGSILADWRQISLAWGARTLGETAHSVIASSYYEPNPYLLSPPVYRFASDWHWLLFPMLGAACLLHLVGVLGERPGLRSQASRWLAAWGLSAAGILVVTLAIHRLMYRLGHILMPLGRRAVFVVPLCMLAIGALVALRAPARRAAWVRAAALAMLWVTAAYFIGCLRLTYFMDWKYNADAKDLYSVVAYYNHTYKVRDVSSNWRYVAVLNFYRTLSGHESLEEIPSGPAELAAYPPGKPLYVLYFASDVPFIGREKLKVVYHNRMTDATVAIRPEIESGGCQPAGR
ncbi:MAG: hypothetical protein ACLQU1_34490 [Bryobacteraceae bacterium]